MDNSLNRRKFIKQTALASLALTAGGRPLPAEASEANGMWRKLPRWYGFNLQEKFMNEPDDLSRIAPEWSFFNQPFLESDFEWIADFGFNFVRLPMSYKCWTAPDDWMKMVEAPLKEIDQAVEWGRQYKLHVNLNFHRAPGYCVNQPAEPLSLWDDEKALEVCAYHWKTFAERYQGIPSERLSFDLLNEPARTTNEKYAKVVARLVGAIREADPNRLIIADGLGFGNLPVPELVPLKIGQSTRGYAPTLVSHFRASWGSDKDGHYPMPTWPLKDERGNTMDKQALFAGKIKPWKKLEALGCGVHVGEWGCYNRTPHAVALAWMKDNLELWRDAGWGWALWCFRGSFGILDSGRAEVKYEGFHGHRLDRKMLELLKEHMLA